MSIVRSCFLQRSFKAFLSKEAEKGQGLFVATSEILERVEQRGFSSLFGLTTDLGESRRGKRLKAIMCEGLGFKHTKKSVARVQKQGYQGLHLLANPKTSETSKT
jgi:hypothetical protein